MEASGKPRLLFSGLVCVIVVFLLYQSSGTLNLGPIYPGIYGNGTVFIKVVSNRTTERQGFIKVVSNRTTERQGFRTLPPSEKLSRKTDKERENGDRLQSPSADNSSVEVSNNDSKDHNSTIKTSDTPFNQTDMSNYSSSGELAPKIILLWTKLFGKDWHWMRNPNPFSRCEYSNCLLTNDKTKLKEASMLIFHKYEKPNFPSYRDPRQLYVHYTMDPPGLLHNTRIDVYNDAINMTANYRKDSSIPFPYGHFERLENPTSDKPYLPAIPASARNSSVAWMVSHCLTNSKRHLYVKELSKYIDISISGKCGNITCPKELGYSECIDRLASEYKFYLAFENNVCKDYFSEKALNILKVDMIPVVLGGADYERDFPPRSYINVKDFKSPKDLAGYLHYLSKNETAYNEYLQWKLSYKRGFSTRMCDLCKFLHDSAYSRGETIVPPHKARNMTLREWWAGPTACDNGLIDRWRQHW